MTWKARSDMFWTARMSIQTGWKCVKPPTGTCSASVDDLTLTLLLQVQHQVSHNSPSQAALVNNPIQAPVEALDRHQTSAAEVVSDKRPLWDKSPAPLDNPRMQDQRPADLGKPRVLVRNRVHLASQPPEGLAKLLLWGQSRVPLVNLPHKLVVLVHRQHSVRAARLASPPR